MLLGSLKCMNNLQLIQTLTLLLLKKTVSVFYKNKEPLNIDGKHIKTQGKGGYIFIEWYE